MVPSNNLVDLSTQESIDKWIAILIEEFSKPPPKITVMECASAAVLTICTSAELLSVLKSAVQILETSSNFYERSCLKKVVAECLGKLKMFSDEEKWEVVRMAAHCSRSGFIEGSISAITGAQLLVDHATKNGVSDEAAGFAKNFLQHLRGEAALYKKVDSILMVKDKAYAFNKLIFPVGVFSLTAREDIKKATQEVEEIWFKILEHAKSCGGTKPSKKWLDKSKQLLKEIGTDTFDSCMKKWLPLYASGAGSNDDLVKGFVWMTSLIPSAEMTHLLSELATTCFKKIPGKGAFSPKVANACVAAMAAVSSEEAIVELGKLEAKAKKPSARNQIEKALQGAADKTGMSVDEMQELNVPKYGFTEVGRQVTQLGDYKAVLAISDSATVELTFITANGKEQSSVPSAVKTNFSTEIKELKKTKDEIEKLLPSLRYRIEHSLINQRHWNFAAWCERYHNHPIAGSFSRTLIWSFNGKPVMWREGRFADVSNNPVETTDSTIIELWHPIAADAQDVKAWRKLLHDLKITQPFKQAHREIYVLTDAERQTATYSNRFAAHIIRQSQFVALCHQRGWRFATQGGWDQELSVPVLKLPRWNLNAEFWVDRVETEMNEAGFLLYLSTDQVRFCRPEGKDTERVKSQKSEIDWADEAEPGFGEEEDDERERSVPLDEILPVVFSEVMRDVDLFVGVTSIGNDPEWQDHALATHNPYWERVSFGDLNATAETRKEVLQEIIPLLQIADRCSFADKFLFVRGDIRTYKIHLGSGNILMEPNDQYLCIVQARSSGKSAVRIHLPFEGDHLLSVILSKALLLAEDTKITDPSIVSQIRRK